MDSDLTLMHAVDAETTPIGSVNQRFSLSRNYSEPPLDPKLYGSPGSRRRQAVLKAVNLGDDADTTGAVCGQLAGTCWSVAGIPPDGLLVWPNETSSEKVVGALQASCR